jgi:hypothetical protein
MTTTKETKELAYLIGRKWFLSGEKLASRVGIYEIIIIRVLYGVSIAKTYYNKLRNYLENYRGEWYENYGRKEAL